MDNRIPRPRRFHPRGLAAITTAMAGVLVVIFSCQSAFSQGPQPIVPSTIADYFQPGTQPLTFPDPLLPAGACTLCHANYNAAVEPFGRWKASMMAQAARDPLFHACLAIAEQDASGSGEMCIRCHTPNGWTAGNSVPSDGSALSQFDYDGVTCNFCHRLVDPEFQAGVSPGVDLGIINALANAPSPTGPHNGQFILDPLDRRRGPFVLQPFFGFHDWFLSPYHQESALCGTCHDVSNPNFTRQGNTYIINDLGVPHPTFAKADMFPIERTYSEWLQSDFAAGPIDMGGRFGGNKVEVSTCQDCHMPDATGFACAFTGSSVFRTDLPLHDFYGANTWVPQAILNLDTTLQLYDLGSNMTPFEVDEAIAGNLSMLDRASDMEITRIGTVLNVRIINQTGHKLPTGYPEGRRMWVNVRFFDAGGNLVLEHGAYDGQSASLTTIDTKVYEAKLGLDFIMSLATGLPEGESFHFALNNKYYKDNRIPPRGFTNAGFLAVQAEPVNYTYADGQYWDDTLYPIPAGAVSVEANLYYQTTSKEYIEFLRDANVTNNAGQIAFDQWELTGKSAPALMDSATMALDPLLVRGDCNNDGSLSLIDPVSLLNSLFLMAGPVPCDDACDVNDDGDLNLTDAVYELMYLFASGAPIPDPIGVCGPDTTSDGLGCALFDACP